VLFFLHKKTLSLLRFVDCCSASNIIQVNKAAEICMKKITAMQLQEIVGTLLVNPELISNAKIGCDDHTQFVQDIADAITRLCGGTATPLQPVESDDHEGERQLVQPHVVSIQYDNDIETLKSPAWAFYEPGAWEAYLRESGLPAVDEPMAAGQIEIRENSLAILRAAQKLKGRKAALPHSNHDDCA
jgi:hypothetical protein